MEGWIKLHRRLINWEWYNDSKMVHLLLHLIMSANHKDGKWKGVLVKRGETIVGLNKLKEQTGISVQSLRTCMNRLKSTSEITIKTTNKYSVVTILNYDSYQSQEVDNKQTNKQLTNKQQTTNIQSTTNKNEKNKNNENNNKVLPLKVFKDDIHILYDSILPLFPVSTTPKNQKQTDNWKDELRKLLEIDGYDTQTIHHIVKVVRADQFWSKNFLSIMKLRQTDKNGIKYIVIFIEQFKQKSYEPDEETRKSIEHLQAKSRQLRI